MRTFYFDNVIEDNDTFEDLLKDFDYKLPSEKELKKVERMIKTTQQEDYVELVGTDSDSDL